MTKRFKLKLREKESGKEFWEEFKPGASAMRKIKKYMRTHELLAVSSKNEKIQAAIQGFIDTQQEQGYVNPMDGMRAGAGVLGQSVSETRDRVAGHLIGSIRDLVPGLRGKKEEDESE